MNTNTETINANAIDFRILPANVPSLCIPRVYPNINEIRIRKIFDELTLGEIERVDIVSKTTEKGDKFNRVFIHFKRWFSEGNAVVARERLINGKDIKIIYDDPWFWKVSAYREPNQKPKQQQQTQTHIKKKVMLIIESDDEEKESVVPNKKADTKPHQYDRYSRPRDQDQGYYDDRRPRDQQDRRPRDQQDRGYYDDRRPRDQQDRGYYDDRRPRDYNQKPREYNRDIGQDKYKPKGQENFKKTKKEDAENKNNEKREKELTSYPIERIVNTQMDGGVCLQITKKKRQTKSKEKESKEKEPKEKESNEKEPKEKEPTVDVKTEDANAN